MARASLSKLKRGKIRYVPMPPELAAELRRCPIVLGEGRIFPPKPGAKGERQRVEKSFEVVLRMAGIEGFRFHDLRHTFASWYMMNAGDLYELAKILGHSNIRMTERYAKLAKNHIAKTGNTARATSERAVVRMDAVFLVAERLASNAVTIVVQ